MSIFEIVKQIRESKDQHFISVDKNSWNKWFWMIYPIMCMNKNYKPCIIYRKEYKFLKDIVVIGLKWNGKNVKRRTSGYAKEFIRTHKDAKCLYCEKNLTYRNATTDHIIPISSGGNNCQINLIVSCFDCNNERGSMKFFDYLKVKNPKYKNQKHPFI